MYRLSFETRCFSRRRYYGDRAVGTRKACLFIVDMGGGSDPIFILGSGRVCLARWNACRRRVSSLPMDTSFSRGQRSRRQGSTLLWYLRSARAKAITADAPRVRAMRIQSTLCRRALGISSSISASGKRKCEVHYSESIDAHRHE